MPLMQWSGQSDPVSRREQRRTGAGGHRPSAKSASVGLRSTYLVLVGARQLPPPAPDVLSQLADLNGVVLIRGADSGVNGRSHSLPRSAASAAPNSTTSTTITSMVGKSCQSISDAEKPKSRPSQNWRALPPI